MDSTSKKLLERMHRDGASEQFAFWLFDDAVRLEAEACGLSVEDFANTINHLIAEGLAEYVFTRDGYRSGVKLTHKGVHYKEFEKAERVKTIWVPIGISVATAIITSIITGIATSLLTLMSQGML